MCRLAAGRLLLCTAFGSLIRLVDKLVLVAQVVIVNVDVAERVGDGVLGGRLVVVEEVLEGG